MAKLHPAKLTLPLFAVAFVALLGMACSGGAKEAAVSNPGVNVPPGLSVTLYASPT